MKLQELKQATRHLHQVDTDHEFQIGRLAYRMGINREACSIKLGLGRDAWLKGWDVSKRDWENLLRRNNCDGQRTKLWM